MDEAIDTRISLSQLCVKLDKHSTLGQECLEEFHCVLTLLLLGCLIDFRRDVRRYVISNKEAICCVRRSGCEL